MITMRILGVTLDGATNTPILVLQEENGEDVLPIWLGASEAMSISMALNNIALERPLSHVLLLNTLEALNAKLSGVSITDLREGTFYALLEIIVGERLVQVDCRPSDGVALAVRAKAPILVAESVLAKALSDRTDTRSSFADRRPSDISELLIRRAVPDPVAKDSDTSDRGTASVAAAPTLDLASISNGARQPSRKGVSASGDEQSLAELLRTLEPASKRVM